MMVHVALTPRTARTIGNPMGGPPPDKLVGRRTPPTQRFGQIPILQFAGFDRVPDIEGALQALALGNFRTSSLLADALMRDDRIWATVDTRLGNIRGSDVEVQPANQSTKAAKVAQVLGGNEDEIGVWEDIFSGPLVTDILQYGFLNSVAPVEIVWETRAHAPSGDKMWMPRLVPHHPQFCYWDWGARRYKLIVENGVIDLPDVMSDEHSDGKWFIWCPYGYQYAWRHAMIKPLADLYLQRRWVCRDWARYNEKHGSPADIAFVPEDAKDEDKEAFFSDVVTRGSDTAVMVPRRDGQTIDSGYGLQILEAKARTYESFRLQLEKLDNSIAIVLLGQNLTTEVQKGTGSRAAESGHQKVADIKTREDAAIMRAFRQQVLHWWALYNFGDTALAPNPRYSIEPPVDSVEEGTGFKAIGEGVKALEEANPRTDVDAIYEQLAVPMLSDAELALKQKEKMERAAEMAKLMPQAAPFGGAPGGGGAPPFGKPTPGKPVVDDEEEDTEPMPGKKPAADEDDEEEDEEPTEKATATLKNTGLGVVDRYTFQGFAIAVENKAGTDRFWYDAEANVLGKTRMQCDYGFFADHQGADGEELDVYIGHDKHARMIHVVRQLKAPDYLEDDEDKVFAGFPDQASALAAYVAHRNDGERAVARITSMPVERFRQLLTKRRGGKLIAKNGHNGHSGVMHLRNVSTVRPSGAPGKRKRKLYPDHVGAHARRMAATAMQVDLHHVKAAIKQAHSYPDLKRRLEQVFKTMHPGQLAKVVEKACIMARAGGMDSAWQQV